MGTESRKLKRAAASREKPSSIPVVMVLPDRDVPGTSASAWPMPMASAERARDVLHAAPVGGEALRAGHDEPPEDEREGDDAVAERLDAVLEELAQDRGRHRAERDVPGQPRVGGAERLPVAEPAQPGRGDAPEVLRGSRPAPPAWCPTG